LSQSPQGFDAILLLAAELLRLDDQHAVKADAVVAQGQQPLLVLLAQDAGGTDVKAQMDGAGHLVDILATRALRADGPKLDLFFRDLDVHGLRRLARSLRWPIRHCLHAV
jgi:hypothetical protein